MPRWGRSRTRFQSAILSGALVGALACIALGDVPVSLSLAGTWAELQVYSELLPFPAVGQIRNTNTAALRVEIEQTGSSLLLHDHYCRITVKSTNPLARVEIPDSFLAVLIKGPVAAALDSGGSVIRFCQEWQTEIAGARLANPDTEPLPTDASDPRVIDEDGDGHPGVTLQARASG